MAPARRRIAPRRYARLLLARRRSARSDLSLGTLLAAVAGLVNAGGFFALGQYTSHMTGYLSQLADMAAIGAWGLALRCIGAILAFVLGAAGSTWIINRFRGRGRAHAQTLLIEGALLLVFPALAAGAAPDGARLQAALLLLCFVMGFQNAAITKISGARIRTTHVTGMVTDIGIELGRALYDLTNPGAAPRLDRPHLRVQLRIVGAFFLGGLTGAAGFALVGHGFALPAAALLLALGGAGLGGRSAGTAAELRRSWGAGRREP